ncbi:MAG: alpha/beta hydrolase [Acidobacteria bacterium]|nr:alpha/beta hydrolase [Acidobacteriota bacterium]
MPPLVFLHGVLRNGSCITPLVPALSSRWRIHTPDARGHGSAPRGESYLVVDYIPGTIHYLQQQIREPAILYGHSMGAMVAAAVAAQEPELVRAVVLEDPPFQEMGERILTNRPRLSYFTAIRQFAGAQDPVDQLAARIAREPVLAPDGVSETTIGHIRDATTIRYLARCLRSVDPAVLDPILAGRWLDGYEMDRVFAGLQCPALLFRCDPAAGGLLTAEDAEAASTCTHVFLRGVGHQAHWTATETVARYTLEFLLSLE